MRTVPCEDAQVSRDLGFGHYVEGDSWSDLFQTREAKIVALDVPDREAILRVLEECPDELLELRATLLQEHVWRKREGLA